MRELPRSEIMEGAQARDDRSSGGLVCLCNDWHWSS